MRHTPFMIIALLLAVSGRVEGQAKPDTIRVRLVSVRTDSSGVAQAVKADTAVLISIAQGGEAGGGAKTPSAGSGEQGVVEAPDSSGQARGILRITEEMMTEIRAGRAASAVRQSGTPGRADTVIVQPLSETTVVKRDTLRLQIVPPDTTHHRPPEEG